MKTIARIVLFIFITFLITPTVVGVLKKSADTSIFYSSAEEENMHKEIKAFLYDDFISEITYSFRPSTKAVLSDNLLKHDNIAATIFIPPPEQV